MKKLSNESGFSVVEGFLILIVIAIVGFTGWYVWHSNQATNKTYNSAAKSAVSSPSKKAAVKPVKPVDPMSGWKKYTSTTEPSYSFKYPGDWAVSTDGTQLTSNGGFLMTLKFTKSDTEPVADPSAAKPTVWSSAAANILTVSGAYSGNIDYIGDATVSGNGDGLVHGFQYSSSATDSTSPVFAGGYIVDIHAQTKSPESDSAVKNDVNYANATLVLYSVTIN